MTKLSIIIPCYNSKDYVSQAIESVKQQLYADWECIIINDGSTDNTERIVLDNIANDGRFKYLTIVHGGPGKARNIGLSMAIGKYILPLDSDDLLLPEYTKDGVDYLGKHQDCSLYYAPYQYMGRHNTPSYIKWNGYKHYLEHPIFYASGIFRKDHAISVGGYNEDLELWEDWEFWIRYLYHNDKVEIPNKVGWRHRVVDDSRHNSADYKMLLETKKEIARLNKEIYKEYNLYNKVYEKGNSNMWFT